MESIIQEKEQPDKPKDEEKRECRICLSSEPISTVIAPCKCAGTSKWVHRSCLDEWIRRTKNPKNTVRCPVCRSGYKGKRKCCKLCCVRVRSCLMQCLMVGLFVVTLGCFGCFCCCGCCCLCCCGCCCGGKCLRERDREEIRQAIERLNNGAQ